MSDAAQSTQAKSSTTTIGILLASAFVVILNETIIGVAMPSIMAEWDLPARTVQWLATVAMLTVASIIPTTGYLLQRWSVRTVYMVAMFMFLLGTTIAGFAPSFTVLLIARIVQSVGGALLMPLLMTTVMHLVAPHQRGATMGRVSLVIAVAPALGPTVAGFIMESFSWRAVFLFMLPVGLICALVGTYMLRGETSQDSSVKLDGISLLLSVTAFSTLIYGISSIGTSLVADTSMTVPLVMIAVGVASLALFVHRQYALIRTPDKDPLLDLRVLHSANYRHSVILVFLTMMIFYGVIILLPLYVQQVHGESPRTAGLVTLPGSLVMGILGPQVGRVFDRFGPRYLMIAGTVLVTLGFLSMLVFFTPTVNLWIIAGIWVLTSTGLAMINTPLNLNALESVKPSLYSHGSAILSTGTRLAGALGTALFITTMSISAQLYTPGTSSRYSSLNLPPAVEAMAHGMHVAYIMAFIMGICIVLLAVAFRLPVKNSSSAAAQAQADTVAAEHG